MDVAKLIERAEGCIADAPHAATSEELIEQVSDSTSVLRECVAALREQQETSPNNGNSNQ